MDHKCNDSSDMEPLPDSTRQASNEPLNVLVDFSLEEPDSSECEDMLADDDYVPSSTDESEVASEGEEDQEKGKFFLVHEDNLAQLMRRCQECGNPITEKTHKTIGSMVVYHLSCMEGHTISWTSQPSIRKMALGNLMLASATLYTGLTYTRIATFAKAMNLPIIQKSTFHNVQRMSLFPVVQEAWRKEQERVLSLRKDCPLALSGDCRCDSPGHCAKYGGYTLMDMEAREDGPNKILSLHVVQCNEVITCMNPIFKLVIYTIF